MNDKQSVSPEEYKVAVLKQNFARRVTDYEDLVADLQTENAMLRQQLQQVADGSEEVPDAAEVPPPPAPPTE